MCTAKISTSSVSFYEMEFAVSHQSQLGKPGWGCRRELAVGECCHPGSTGPAQGLSISLCTCQGATLDHIMTLFAFLGHLLSSALHSLSRGRFLSVPCSCKHFRAIYWETSDLYPLYPWTSLWACVSCSLCQMVDVTIADEAAGDFSSCFKGCWVLHKKKKSTLSVELLSFTPGVALMV